MNKPKRNPVELEWPQQESIPGLGEYLESIPADYDVEQMRRSFPHLLGAMVTAIEAEVNFHGIQAYWLARTDGVDVTERLPQAFGSDSLPCTDSEYSARGFSRGAARYSEKPKSMILGGYYRAVIRARKSARALNYTTYKPLANASRRIKRNGKARR